MTTLLFVFHCETYVSYHWDGCGDSKMKEILMKNIGVKVLITNRIIWNSKQIENKNKQQQTRDAVDGGRPCMFWVPHDCGLAFWFGFLSSQTA